LNFNGWEFSLGLLQSATSDLVALVIEIVITVATRVTTTTNAKSKFPQLDMEITLLEALLDSEHMDVMEPALRLLTLYASTFCFGAVDGTEEFKLRIGATGILQKVIQLAHSKMLSHIVYSCTRAILAGMAMEEKDLVSSQLVKALTPSYRKKERMSPFQCHFLQILTNIALLIWRFNFQI
jgi:hypothetical protein